MICKELEEIQSNLIGNCDAVPIKDSDLFHWKAVI